MESSNDEKVSMRYADSVKGSRQARCLLFHVDDENGINATAGLTDRSWIQFRKGRASTRELFCLIATRDAGGASEMAALYRHSNPC